MSTITCFTQIEKGAPCYDFPAVADKGQQNLFDIQQTRLTINQCNHIDAKNVLHHGLLVQVVQNNFRYFTTAQFDDNTHAVFIGLIT